MTAHAPKKALVTPEMVERFARALATETEIDDEMRAYVELLTHSQRRKLNEKAAALAATLRKERAA